MTRRCDLTNVGVMTGNTVSKSKRRVKREFLPNLKKISFKSDALGVNLTLRVTTKALRTVNKYGNIDAFIINYRCNKLSDTAKKLRKKIEKALIKKGEFENVKIAKTPKKRVKKTTI